MASSPNMVVVPDIGVAETGDEQHRDERSSRRRSFPSRSGKSSTTRVRREAVALERSFRAETDPTASDALTCLTPDDADKTPSERRLKRVHSAMSMASQLSPW